MAAYAVVISSGLNCRLLTAIIQPQGYAATRALPPPLDSRCLDAGPRPSVHHTHVAVAAQPPFLEPGSRIPGLRDTPVLAGVCGTDREIIEGAMVLVNADAVRDWLIDEGYNRSKIVVIRNGVDLSRFGAAPETFAPVPEWALGPRSPHDHVRLLMEIVMGELRRPDHPRLVELDDGRWWLRDARDVAQVRAPLADRLEWSVFGLLSTAEGIDEESFFGRIARMYGGHDTPDEELVRAVLDSYREPGPAGAELRTHDELAARHADHGTIVGMLAEYGHRLGLRVWVSEHEQRRAYREGTVGGLLSDEERRAYLPLVAEGDPQVLETLDCLWYVRGKATFVFEVEWTAMVTDALLVRGPKLPTDERMVRFLVLPDERIELLRHKLSRSALLRRALEEGNWHVLRWSGVRRLAAAPEASLEMLAPLLGLDPEVERQPEQIALFE